MERQACEKTNEAISLQYDLDKKIEVLSKAAEKRAIQMVGERPGLVIIAIYTVTIKQEARLATGSIPLVQTTVLTVRKDSGVVSFLWDF